MQININLPDPKQEKNRVLSLEELEKIDESVRYLQRESELDPYADNGDRAAARQYRDELTKLIHQSFPYVLETAIKVSKETKSFKSKKAKKIIERIRELLDQCDGLVEGV